MPMDAEEQARIIGRRLVTHVRRALWRKLEWDKPGWDPDEAHEIISRTLKNTLPKDAPFKVTPPTREQLVALRLMGKDIKSTLHLDIEFIPEVPAESVALNLVIVGNTL